MRKRKRDWPVIVYKFWVRPIGDIPQELWKLAHGMNDLWNTLVEKRSMARDGAAGVEDKETKREIWKSFWAEAAKHVGKADLNWEIKGEVLDRFTAASRRTLKDHSELKPRHGLRRVMIPHRFTDGGIPVARVFDPGSTAKRLKIRPVPVHAYHNNTRASARERLTSGVFGLTDSAKIDFETILHRPIPAGSILKKSLWVGEFDRSLPQSRRWTWSLHLVCEIPEEEYYHKVAGDERPSCGIDLGWRVMSHREYLRIGMIVDSLGRLPLLMARTRDRNKKDWISSLDDLIEIDSRIALKVEAAKSGVVEILAEKPAGFDKVRQGGLRKLLRESKDQALIDALARWDERDRALCAIRATVRGRIRRRKSWLYQNLAAWLVTTYGTINMEGNLALKSTSIRVDDPALRNAAKYRQWAGVGELRIAIKNAARKHGCEIFEVEPFNTTRRCFVCSAEQKGDRSKLYLKCANGHRWDQDLNAACNILFSQIGGDSARKEVLRSVLDKSSENSLNIPANLKAVAVPCSLQ